MSKEVHKLVRITTVPLSLEKLLENQLQFMQQFYEVTAVSSDSLRLQKVGEKEGVKVFSINLSRQITPISDLKALWNLYQFLKKEKPLIVHTHTPKAGIVGMLAAKLTNVPIRLHTVAGLPLMETQGVKRKLLNFIEKLTYTCASKVYPNSYGLKEIILSERFCKENKLKVIGNGSSNGINLQYFNPQLYTVEENSSLRTSLGINDKDFVFIFVGRLVGDKGINELVTAFGILDKDVENVKLLLVGDYETELDPLELITIKEIENNPNIIAIGYQADVRPYFAIADILTFPSYREGFPNVVMQAGAMNLPAIVSNINGCNEIIKEEENGLIIPVKDLQALLTAMEKVLRDENLRLRLKENARRMITERYDREVIWDALLKEYQQLEHARK